MPLALVNSGHESAIVLSAFGAPLWQLSSLLKIDSAVFSPLAQLAGVGERMVARYDADIKTQSSGFC